MENAKINEQDVGKILENLDPFKAYGCGRILLDVLSVQKHDIPFKLFSQWKREHSQ